MSEVRGLVAPVATAFLLKERGRMVRRRVRCHQFVFTCPISTQGTARKHTRMTIDSRLLAPPFFSPSSNKPLTLFPPLDLISTLPTSITMSRNVLRHL